MGKANRNRKKHAAAAAAPRRAVPEMLPNTADSANNVPERGRLSEYTRDQLDRDVNAWGLLNTYIALLMSLEDRPEDLVPAGDTPAEQRRNQDIVERLRELQPLEFAGHRDDAAQFVAWLKPRWRGRVVDMIFREITRWTTESGFTLDRRDWFAGAVPYLRFMVPAAHLDPAVALLDHDALDAETERINAPFPERERTIPAFVLDKPERSVWFTRAMRAHPVAMVHAAAALAAWVHAQPDAVLDVAGKRAELAKRVLDFAEIVGTAPGRNPNEPEEPEPAWTPPWEITEPVPTWRTDPIAESADIAYDGPPISLWRAAWLYAEVITRVGGLPDEPDHHTDETRALLAHAISVEAAQLDPTLADPAARVATPGVLGPVSLAKVSVGRLHALRSIVEFAQAGLGAVPVDDEPGVVAYRTLRSVATADGLTAEQVLADPDLKPRVEDCAAEWERHRTAADRVVFGTVLAIATEDDTDVTLARLGRHLNEYLATQPT